MKLLSSASFLGFLAVAGLIGCQSPRESRIAEKRELFAALPAQVQGLVKEGLIDVGFTSDLVYLALGKPNRIQPGETAQGLVTTWIYKNMLLADPVAMKLGMNNPGARLQPGSLVSSNAPGEPSIGSTKNTGPQPTLDVADAKVGTLLVDFLNDRVSNIRLEP